MTNNYTYVYFITTINKGNTPIKIGVSKKPEIRIKELQTGNPHKLKIIKLVTCLNGDSAYVLESCLHSMSKSRNKKLMGEWFKIYEPINELIGMCLKRMPKNSSNIIGNKEFIDQANEKLKKQRKSRKEKRLKKGH